MAGRDLPPSKRGYSPHEVVSALQKAIRRSDPDAAVYWAFELVRSGYGPWCWKRLRIIAIEDCSPEATGLVSDLHAMNAEWKADPEHGLLLVARAVIALAIAPKARVADWLTLKHTSDHVPRRDIPDEALDKHTHAGKRMGRGWAHFVDEASVLVQWTGSLEDLEAEARDMWRRRVVDGEVQASNPWDRSQAPDTDQLTMEES